MFSRIAPAFVSIAAILPICATCFAPSSWANTPRGSGSKPLLESYSAVDDESDPNGMKDVPRLVRLELPEGSKKAAPKPAAPNAGAPNKTAKKIALKDKPSARAKKAPAKPAVNLAQAKPIVIQSNSKQVAERIDKLEKEILDLKVILEKTRALEQAAAPNAKAFDVVNKDQKDSIIKRLRLVEQIIEDYNRAYDYRSLTTQEVRAILADLRQDEQKKVVQRNASSVAELTPSEAEAPADEAAAEPSEPTPRVTTAAGRPPQSDNADLPILPNFEDN